MIQPSCGVFQMRSLLNRLSDEFGLLASNKGLHLEVTECEETVYSDALLLERVLRNLLSNAINHTERGTVSLICRPVAAGLELTVRDTGIGISAEDLPDIFEEYYQVGSPHRDRMNGLGLGLAIVSRLEKLLGLNLMVSSALGEGTCFVMVVQRHHREI